MGELTEVAALLVDDIDYVDNALYEDVWNFFQENVDWTGQAQVSEAAGEGTRLLHREARLLDARHYEEWLGLFVPHCVYWVPRNDEVGDPRIEPAIHFDDHRRLADRIALIRTGHLHAQTPPSRTCRVVSNVECRASDGQTMDIHSCLTIHEERRGRSQLYVGRQFHRVTRRGGSWQIKYRVLVLLDRDAAQGNITFIL
jgi:3-phenylpropionate/cinnamic acid dioxygenase small subunit